MLAAALVDKRAGFAVAAKAEVLVMHQLGGGEAVVQLGQRDVLRADAGLLVGLLGGAARKRADVGQRAGRARSTGRRSARGRHARTLAAAGELLELVLGDQDRGGGAVAGRAAHVERVGIRDHARVEHVLERHFIAILRERIFGRVLDGTSPRSWRSAPAWCRTCAYARRRPGRTRRASGPSRAGLRSL